MIIKFLPKRIISVILNPVKAWEGIYSENSPVKHTRNNIVMPLTFLVAVSASIGSFIFTHSQLSFVYSVFIGIKYLILLIIVFYVSAIILNEITNALDLGRNFTISFKIITYSLVPFLLCLIVSLLFESLFFINILAFYGLYIFWVGAERMLNPPEHKKMPMLIAVLVCVTGLFIMTNWILTKLIDGIYFTFLA
jgi:hypothetical protein